MEIKRYIPLVLGLFLVLIHCPGVTGTKIKVGYFELAPHGYDDKTGAAIDYFSMIATELDWIVDFEPTPLARMMSTNELDVILYLGKNSAREAKLTYAAKPLLDMQGGIAISKKNPIGKISDAKDLIPLKIGAWLQGYRSELMQHKNLRLEDYPGEAVSMRALQMIANGRLDAFYCPEIISLNFTIQKSGLGDKLKVLQLPEPPTGLYVAFNKNFPEKRIREFNLAHEKMEKKISYKNFLKGYLATKK